MGTSRRTSGNGDEAARLAAEETARKEAEETARKEAEETARKEAEEKRKAKAQPRGQARDAIEALEESMADQARQLLERFSADDQTDVAVMARYATAAEALAALGAEHARQARQLADAMRAEAEGRVLVSVPRSFHLNVTDPETKLNTR